jgi:hypothetical protein
MVEILGIVMCVIAGGVAAWQFGRVAYPIVLLVFLLVFLAGCVGQPVKYVELGAGKNTSYTNSVYTWNDGGAGPLGASIEAGVEWNVKNNEDALKFKCRWLHLSHWFVGPPFNDRAESSVDHFGCAVRHQW